MEDKIRCNNCNTVYPATRNYCPMCGVHKWYKKEDAQSPGNAGTEESRTAKEINKNHTQVHDLKPPASLENLSEIDDVEKILTDEISIQEKGQKNVKAIRSVILILLILLNLTALKALISKKKEAGIIDTYNQVISLINQGEYQKAGEIVVEFDESNDKTFLLGLIYFKAKRYDRAYEYLQKVSDIPAYTAYTDAMIGYIHYHEGRHRESYECFKRALRSLPKLPNLNTNYNNIRLYIVKE